MFKRDTSIGRSNKVSLSLFKARLYVSSNRLSTILLDGLIMTNIGHDFKT